MIRVDIYISLELVLLYYCFYMVCFLVDFGFVLVLSFGHFFFEKNRPATFVYPGLSLASDFIMAWDTITGQLPSKMKSAKEKFGIVE